MGGVFFEIPGGVVKPRPNLSSHASWIFSVWGFAQMQAPYERDGY